MSKPDVIITGTTYPGSSRSEEILKHPALKPLRHVSSTDANWVCGTPHIVKAIEDLQTIHGQNEHEMNLKLTLLIFLIALFIFSLSTGHTTTSFSQGITALYYGDGPLGTVMRQIRLPRAILAILVGASLGVCGAALQGYLRNPLQSQV